MPALHSSAGIFALGNVISCRTWEFDIRRRKKKQKKKTQEFASDIAAIREHETTQGMTSSCFVLYTHLADIVQLMPPSVSRALTMRSGTEGFVSPARNTIHYMAVRLLMMFFFIWPARSIHDLCRPPSLARWRRTSSWH